jgi:ElaB/YqjD/DUF883 family membrane-anchored ribosome-binding protein
MQDTHREKNWANEQKEAAANRESDNKADKSDRSPEQQDESARRSQPWPTNLTTGRTERKAADRHSPDTLLEHGRILQQDARALTNSVQESAQLFTRYITEQVEQRPYTTVGIAAGLGYLLGGGLANRITGTALGTAYRLALALAARELSSRVSIPGLSGESSRQDGSAR